MRDRYPVHGRRWTWRHPWQFVCRCGLDAYPCVVERMLQPPKLTVQVEDELGHVRQRHHWSGGAR